MLAELGGVSKIIIAVGYTDLRLGINGLAQVVGSKYDLNPFEKGTLFLFCGRKTDRIKALLWKEMDSFSCISAWRMAGLTGQGHLLRLQALLRSSTTICSSV